MPVQCVQCAETCSQRQSLFNLLLHALNQNQSKLLDLSNHRARAFLLFANRINIGVGRVLIVNRFCVRPSELVGAHRPRGGIADRNRINNDSRKVSKSNDLARRPAPACPSLDFTARDVAFQCMSLPLLQRTHQDYRDRPSRWYPYPFGSSLIFGAP